MDDLDSVLEAHRRDTITSWGTRRSSKAQLTENKENVAPGLALRTHQQRNIATIRRKVQKISVKYSALNRAKSKKMPSNIRKRYGQKADRLRKSYGQSKKGQRSISYTCLYILYSRKL